MAAGPLSGKRILITRTLDQAAALSEPLRRYGAEPIVVPMIEIVPPASFDELDQAIAELGRTDLLILTSVNAVEAFFNRLGAKSISPTALAAKQLVAVGPKTAEAISAHGIKADLMPEDYRAEGVVALLKDKVAGKRVLYPKAALARDLIPEALSEAGAEVSAPIAYTSAAPKQAAAQLTEALDNGLDLLTFTASSTVRNFAALLSAERLTQSQQVPVASIGPLTTDTAKELGFNVVVQPQASTLEAMIEAVKTYFASQPLSEQTKP